MPWPDCILGPPPARCSSNELGLLTGSRSLLIHPNDHQVITLTVITNRGSVVYHCLVPPRDRLDLFNGIGLLLEMRSLGEQLSDPRSPNEAVR